MPGVAKMVNVGRLLHDAEDIRIIVHSLHIAVPVEGAEEPAKNHLCLWSQILIAEKDNAVIQESLMNFRISLLIDIGNVDAKYLRPERTRQRGYRDSSVILHRLYFRRHDCLAPL